MHDNKNNGDKANTVENKKLKQLAFDCWLANAQISIQPHNIDIRTYLHTVAFILATLLENKRIDKKKRLCI